MTPFLKKTLDECAEHICVYHTTAFFMRQKLLAFLEKAVQQDMLDSLLEADETYVLEAQKGVRVIDRKPRMHGESATKRGLPTSRYAFVLPQTEMVTLWPGV